eukprot:CAMPEP_0179148664 /NCGR_PEP_ID=MMETSP0796-20121207/71962_1 /TAXON_ID=73915 /ORGANISM="Pyrodinium bahamense, Strain pbaha01" /LENGTH=292 /DNA_ID=CAMNT_0020849413 /DNA_START=68 /DNA_END=946 /DNA_ORIENTATION=-
MVDRQEDPSSPCSPLTHFGDQLKDLLCTTIERQTKELDERERQITEREQKLDAYLTQQHSSRKVVLRVGQQQFWTTSDVLLSKPDTYFHGMLNPDFQREDDGSYFIARDGQSFACVLEYLTYGELSPPADNAVLARVRADADFYGLPGLREAVERFAGNGRLFHGMWQSSLSAAHNSFIKWDVIAVEASPALCTLSEDLTQVSFAKEGTYLICVKVTSNPHSGNQGIQLFLNGTIADTAYGTSYEGCACLFTYTLNSVLNAGAKDTISVKNITSSSTVVINSPSNLRIQALD